MERFARAILEAQKIREDSYDKDAADKASEDHTKLVDFANFYRKTQQEAADEAATSVGFDKSGTMPIYLLNTYCWNDIQAWAEEAVKESKIISGDEAAALGDSHIRPKKL